MASDMPEAVEAKKRLIARYGKANPAEADAIVALGGDGYMLQTLHRFMNDGIPIYGMNRGSVGFLMHVRTRIRRSAMNIVRALPAVMTTGTVKDVGAAMARALNVPAVFAVYNGDTTHTGSNDSAKFSMPNL